VFHAAAAAAVCVRRCCAAFAKETVSLMNAFAKFAKAALWMDGVLLRPLVI
jgi:hypothetical protein